MENFTMRQRALYLIALTLAALGVAFATILAPIASAAPTTVFTVNSTADEVDNAIGSGGCQTASGFCTLRAAIQEANFAGGSHGIILPSGTITLTIAGTGEDNSATGDLDIKSNLFITGTGSATTIIDGGGLDRVIHIVGVYPSPEYNVTISGVTLRNGNVLATGGGILSSESTLTLNDVVLFANTASTGGGLGNVGGDARVTLNNSTVSSNSPGGINNNTGFLTLNNTIVYNNLARGGIENSGGIVNVNNSSIYSNSANSGGGGISSNNLLNVTNSSIFSNTAGAGQAGGGIYTSYILTITNSQVYSNVATDGGGIYNFGGTVNIISSTFRSNIASDGGAIYSNLNLSGQNSVTVLNGTISNNTASGANPHGVGGGVVTGTSFTMTNVTVSGNSARIAGGLWMSPGVTQTITLDNVTVARNNASESNGGYYNGGSGTNRIQNSIIAGNAGNIASPDCGGGTLTSQGYNIIGNNNGCTFSSTTGDQVGTSGSPIDAKLGPLSNIGGPTAVHPLLSGSPAINTGNPGASDGIGNHCQSTDQRGVIRPISAQCDIGAFEGTGAALYMPLILR